MRKILSKQDDGKKAKRNQVILGLFLIFIMFFSIAEYSLIGLGQDSSSETGITNIVNYNSFNFSQQNGYWILNKDGKSFIFRYNPGQISFSNASNLPSLEDYSNKVLYIESEDVNAESEIRTNLAQFTGGIIISTNKTCDENVIVIKKGDENRIKSEENCVFIEGEDLVKMSDEFLFNILGVRSK